METLRAIFAQIFGQNSAWFWTMLQAIVVAITLYLIYRQLRVGRYSNMLDTLARLDEKWFSEVMLKARHGICCDYVNPEKKEDRRITYREAMVLDFFEDIGIFLKRRVLEKETVWESYSYSIEHYSQMLQVRVTEFRASSKDQSWYDNFQALAETMRKVSKKRGASTQDKTEQEMKLFARGEIQRLEVAGADAHVDLSGVNASAPSIDDTDDNKKPKRTR